MQVCFIEIHHVFEEKKKKVATFLTNFICFEDDEKIEVGKLKLLVNTVSNRQARTEQPVVMAAL